MIQKRDLRDNKLRFFAISCDSTQNVMLQITEYTYDAYAASISDRNLSSVRMTVNARRVGYALRRISHKRFPVPIARTCTKRTFRVGYYAFHETFHIIMTAVTIRECVRAQTDIA